ncbi:MAG: CDP-diacylglycerol--glycerol-3-phosphate 3-phosphatidyltransferase [bacterium]
MKVAFTPPNQLTYLRILLSPVFMLLIFSSNIVLKQLSVVVFIIALMTDWYDGWVARKWGYISRWGTFIDPLADKFLTSAAFISFVLLDLVPSWSVWIIVIRDITITFLRSYAEYKDKPFQTRTLAKTKTALQFLVLFYILLLYVARHMGQFSGQQALIDSFLDYRVLTIIMAIITAITLWSGIAYIIENWKTVRGLFYFTQRNPESEQHV